MIKKPKPVWMIKKDLQDYCNYIFQHKNNSLSPNTGSEGHKHFITKCLIGYILRELGKEFNAEVIVSKGELGRIDLLNLSDRVIIECETNLTEKRKREKIEKYDNSYITDFIFIDLKKVPNNIGFEEQYILNISYFEKK